MANYVYVYVCAAIGSCYQTSQSSVITTPYSSHSYKVSIGYCYPLVRLTTATILLNQTEMAVSHFLLANYSYCYR